MLRVCYSIEKKKYRSGWKGKVQEFEAVQSVVLGMGKYPIRHESQSWGGRGRRFKSCRLDQQIYKKSPVFAGLFLFWWSL